MVSVESRSSTHNHSQDHFFPSSAVILGNLKLLLLQLSTSGPTRTNLHMPGADKQGARMPLIRQRRDQGRPRPVVNTPGNFAMRLTIGSLFVLFLADVLILVLVLVPGK